MQIPPHVHLSVTCPRKPRYGTFSDTMSGARADRPGLAVLMEYVLEYVKDWPNRKAR
jgi:hypothetical protein